MDLVLNTTDLTNILTITLHFKKHTDFSQNPPLANLKYHRNLQRHDTFADHILIKHSWSYSRFIFVSQCWYFLHMKINQLYASFCCIMCYRIRHSLSLQGLACCVHIHLASACNGNKWECKVLLFTFSLKMEMKGKKKTIYLLKLEWIAIYLWNNETMYCWADF